MRFRVFHRLTAKPTKDSLVSTECKPYVSKTNPAFSHAFGHKILETDGLFGYAREAENGRRNCRGTALTLAIETGNTERVKSVLEQKADPNERIGLGTPPLMLAIRRSMCAETINLLLEKGARVRARNYMFWDSLDEARWAPWLKNEHPELYKKLEQKWAEEGWGYKTKKFFSMNFRKHAKRTSF